MHPFELHWWRPNGVLLVAGGACALTRAYLCGKGNHRCITACLLRCFQPAVFHHLPMDKVNHTASHTYALTNFRMCIPLLLYGRSSDKHRDHVLKVPWMGMILWCQETLYPHLMAWRSAQVGFFHFSESYNKIATRELIWADVVQVSFITRHTIHSSQRFNFCCLLCLGRLALSSMWIVMNYHIDDVCLRVIPTLYQLQELQLYPS